MALHRLVEWLFSEQKQENGELSIAIVDIRGQNDCARGAAVDGL